MMMRNRARNRLKNGFSSITSSGATSTLGALSFCGLLVLSPSLPIAGLAFFLAVAIEGAVFRQNIFAAVDRLDDQKIMLQRAIAARELAKLIRKRKLALKKGAQYTENKFLLDYLNQKEYLHELEENEEKYFGDDKEIAKREIEIVKLRIEEMQDLFTAAFYIKYPEDKELASSIRDLMWDELVIKDLDEEIASKIKKMNLSKYIAIGSGVSAGVVSFSSILSFFLYVGLTVATAMMVTVPFVLLAAVGYGFIMYRTVTDMIQNDTVKKWRDDFHKFWHTPKKDALFFLKAVGAVLLASMIVIAAVATAGTALRFIVKLREISTVIIGVVAWGINLLPSLLFSIKSSFKTVKLVPNLIKRAWHNFKENFSTTLKSENILQLINPFRLASKLFKSMVFLGHMGAVAIASDQPVGIPTKLAIAAGVVNEGVTDLPCIAHAEHDHQHSDEHHHDHHQHSHRDGEEKAHSEEERVSLLHARRKSSHEGCDHEHGHEHGHEHKHEHKHEHDDAEEEEHDHHHGDLLLNKIEKGLNYLSAGWDFLFSATWRTRKQDWENSLRKFFPKAELPKVPELSITWVQYEKQKLILQQAEDYRAAGMKDKADAFANLQREIAKNVNDEKAFKQSLQKEVKAATDQGQPLTVHRHHRLHCVAGLFAKQPAPLSQQFTESLVSDRSVKFNSLSGG